MKNEDEKGLKRAGEDLKEEAAMTAPGTIKVTKEEQ